MYYGFAKIEKGTPTKLSEIYINKTVVWINPIIYYSSEFRKFFFNYISSLMYQIIIFQSSDKKELEYDELVQCQEYYTLTIKHSKFK